MKLLCKFLRFHSIIVNLVDILFILIFRYSWSDRSGRQYLTKETVKTPTIHWQWVRTRIRLWFAPFGYFYSMS